MSNTTTSTKSNLNPATSSTFNTTSPLSRNSTALTIVTSSIHVSIKLLGLMLLVFGVKRNGSNLFWAKRFLGMNDLWVKHCGIYISHTGLIRRDVVRNL
ncbi:unnamed protein product [Trifolium pratense]|uniref:Uncharacterized protein n=1 Tax=Trifolium pratense TaxID=57577 RepID=A0ACB0LM20_TRIPR|nr:unnamed protein product [Trifolium pratense]